MTVQAPFAFIHGAVLEELVIKPQLFTLSLRHGVRGLTGFTDGADQPLGHDAVQRRDEVIGLDPHVHEPADHIKGIVGVHG